jgi:hypothetical protein
MNKLRGAGRQRHESPALSNTGSSIRGRISAPIVADDDEFPIRLPGTGIATPLGVEGSEKQLQLRAPPISSPTVDALDDAIRERGSESTPRQSLHDPPINQQNTVRVSTNSVPPASDEEKPQRKKSTLRGVFGRLFGKKRRDKVRAGQHRSVSFWDPGDITSNIG